MKNKVFYNVVINEHLWMAIIYYFRNCLHANSKDLKPCDDITLEDAKTYANKAIIYLEDIEFPSIYCITRFDNAPHEWVSLYYMILSYIYEGDFPNFYDRKKLYDCNLNELKEYGKLTIDWLKKLANEIRETTDEDL